MSTTADLVSQLKRALKTAGMTYADLAQTLGMAESSVKRMFAKGDMSLSRIDAICRALALDFAELAQRVADAQPLLAALTLEQPQARLHGDTLSLAFDLRASVAGLRLPLRGHLALDSGLRFDPHSQSLYLHEPRLTRLDLPQVPGAPEPQQLLAIGDELLAEYARAQPVYVLSERRQSQVPLGRSIYRVDIEDGRLVIGVSR